MEGQEISPTVAHTPPPYYPPTPISKISSVKIEKVLSLTALAVSVVSATIIIISYVQNRENVKVQKELAKLQLEKEKASISKDNEGSRSFTGRGTASCKGEPNEKIRCNDKIFPVMGCDGNAYANPCFAKRNGVNKFKQLNYD